MGKARIGTSNANDMTGAILWLIWLPVKVARRIRTGYRRRFKRMNLVFEHQGPFDLPIRTDCTVDRYGCFEEVPDHVRAAIVKSGGERALDHDIMEMRDGSVMWAATIDGAVASIWHSRRAEYFKGWFVPLSPGDVVIFRGRTFPEFRGLGISPTVIKYIMHGEVRQGNRAYADCRVHNQPSRRALMKAGFQCIATMKQISREYALGAYPTPDSKGHVEHA